MGYFSKRLISSVFVIFCVLTIVFFLVRQTGDPAALMSPIGATQDEIDALRRDLGLDQPLIRQYYDFLKNCIKGDFGISIRYRQPAFSLVLERFPATLELTGVAFAITIIFGLPLGILAAIKKDSTVDLISSALSLFGQCVPTFWLALMLILLLAVKWPLFPSSGHRGFSSLILPGICVGIFSVGIITRMTRSYFLEVLSSHYITTARAKGLSERIVILKHALRNVAIPLITIMGLQVGPMIGGTIITEYIFGFPGMGRLATQAVLNRDFPVVQAFVVVTSGLIVSINLLIDVLYIFLDPRQKFE